MSYGLSSRSLRRFWVGQVHKEPRLTCQTLPTRQRQKEKRTLSLPQTGKDSALSIQREARSTRWRSALRRRAGGLGAYGREHRRRPFALVVAGHHVARGALALRGANHARHA